MQRSVKNADPTGFSNFTEFPGDLHTGDYLEECFSQVHGPTGFYHVAQVVLVKKKITPGSFAKDKFKDGNLQRNKEVCNTVRWAYTVAACKEFLKTYTVNNSQSAYNSTENAYTALLAFLKTGKAQKLHNCEVALFWGPFMSMFYASIRYQNGLQREAAWMLAAPLFAQLCKKNYLAEAIAHLVNIVAVWPPLIQEIMRKNCSISVTGRYGHCIALDEYVEKYVVKPLKIYATGHSSIKVLNNLSCALPLIGSIREAYKGKEGFDRHHTSKHKVPTTTPDMLMVVNYCMYNQLFMDTNIQSDRIPIIHYDGNMHSTFLPQIKVDIYRKGLDKLKECFSRRVYELFPERRMTEI